MKEKALISEFFDHIAIGDGMVVYGVQDTMKLVEAGAVGKLICYEELSYVRIKLRNTDTQDTHCIYVKPDQVTNADLYKDKETGVAL